MNALCWSSCLWLWFICTGVECLPKLHLSSRYEDDDSATLTMSYIVDDTLIDDDKNYIEAWLLWVTRQTMFQFQQFSHFTLNLNYTITYLENEKDLKSMLQPYKRESYIWPEGAISTLTGYFKGQNQFDIICLVTKLKLNDGFMVRNGYGYHGTQTLCEEPLPILLAYASSHQGYSSYTLLGLILDSISPGIGQPVYHVPSDDLDKVKDQLRKCKGRRDDSSGADNPHEPPLPRPPATPSYPEEPVPPPEPPTDPEQPEVPPPAPPIPGPQPPPGPPPPVGPPSPPETPATTTTTTEAPVPDYC